MYSPDEREVIISVSGIPLKEHMCLRTLGLDAANVWANHPALRYGRRGDTQTCQGSRIRGRVSTEPISIIAMGGNSLIDPALPPTVENQFTITARAMVPIAALLARGGQGGGQVGIHSGTCLVNFGSILGQFRS